MRRLFKFKELIATIITIASSILFFKSQDYKIFSFSNDTLLIYSAAINIIILVIAIFLFSTLIDDFYLIKRKHGEYDSSALNELASISRILKIPADQAKYFVERTSAVVGQLVSNFSLFLWPLIIFYSL